DLDFDQRSAMSALNYLDKVNGTNILKKYMPIYREWVSDKYSQDIHLSIEHFNHKMEQFEKIKNA
ncbi:MAG TPA: DUF6000 family protein, partial [Flavobacteriaceae bacterium]|nr:DUF6000 family protein [Flavobacteriaceae bacterium]